MRNTIAASILLLLTAAPSLADEAKGPGDTYQSFHVKMRTAKSFDDIKDYMSKKVLESRDKDNDKMPPGMEATLFKLMQDLSPNKVVIVKQDVTGDTAVLTCEAPGYQDPIVSPEMRAQKSETTGKVILVKEDGVWKIEKEEWNTKSGNSASSRAMGPNEEMEKAHTKGTDAPTTTPVNSPSGTSIVH